MFHYESIERVYSITKHDFYQNYYLKQKPVVVEHLIDDWPAYRKWNLDYIKEVAGDQLVPLFNNDKVDPAKKINEPIAEMPMSSYVDILKAGPTDLRIFLYNLLKHVPKLGDDVVFPDMGLKLLKGLPMLFFGGEGSNVFMHYDPDYANMLHFHFAGKKRCVLVPPDQSKYMYKLPFSWIQHEDINFDNPDFDKWPALRNVQPLVADLNHGEMLFMPEGYWHYMQYQTPGFSLSLRAMPRGPVNLLNAVLNLALIRYFDNFMRKWKGREWIAYKNNRCVEHTNRLVGAIQPANSAA